MAEKIVQNIKKEWKNPKLWLGLIFIIGTLARLLFLDKSPMGLHQDEAYSAYNSWAVMKYGTDSYGYTRPVYYTVWGSGMSVLYSYLTMPLFALFGISTWTIRLPQAILGCICILAVYELGKELFSEKTGLAFAAFLAINPWHIQQSRFGLDANLAVPMLLFAVLFLCRYLNGKRKSIWGAALFFGLTLYCYALTWVLVPVMIVLCLLLYRKRFCFDRSLLGAGILLFLLALPLMLFLAVNFGLIPEIRTALGSIPKLQAMRTGEMGLSLSAFKRRFLWMLAMLWAQHDDIWWISNEAVGSYYYVTTPFILIGLLYHLVIFVQWIFRKRKLPLHSILAVWFVLAFLMGCNIDTAKYYKVNFIHIPIILYGVLGIRCVLNLAGRLAERLTQSQEGKRTQEQEEKAMQNPEIEPAQKQETRQTQKQTKKNTARQVQAIIVCLCCVLYTGCFGYYLYSQASFGVNYENYGYSLLSHMHWYRYEEAIDRAEELTDGTIGILNLNYANVMLYKKIPPQEYLDTVVYSEGELAFRTVLSIGRYHFDLSPGEETRDVVFVYPYNAESYFTEAGFTTEHVTECYGVAYWEE